MFIRFGVVVLWIIVQHTLANLYECSCHCSLGFYRSQAYSTEYSPQQCVKACIAVPSNPCTPANTYACLGTNCVYSQQKAATIHKCSCQCPYGRDHGNAYAVEYSPQECVKACIAVPWNPCTLSNTYTCLGANCAYASSYNRSTTNNQNLTTSSDTVPPGQTYSNDVVLNGNTFHVYGIMKGRITGHGTVRAYNGAHLEGDIEGNQIDVLISGHVTVSGSLNIRQITIG